MVSQTQILCVGQIFAGRDKIIKYYINCRVGL